ncbi:MAG: flagellar M-ring protein FliF, partial [Deltaproteobacteria bacterium]|nr:flagellar M-ring protein FliF [Deltaproteobacteria bacterium]
MESIKGIMTKLNASLKAMSPGQKIILFLVSAFIFSGFCVMILWSNQEEHSILFSNLSMQDAGAIVEKLKEQKIPYEISGDGSIIRVPAAVVYETRLSLASQGLPRGGGVGFEIFDKSSIGTTDFVLRLNYRRALQGELARTISQFQEIEGARVHLVIPRRSPFFSEEEKARASVAIRLRPGASLARGQVQGIVHLVASSVEALQPSSVTVVDTHGKILSGSPPLSDPVFLSNSQIEYRRSVEKDIERRIESMLEKVLGPGKAIA